MIRLTKLTMLTFSLLLILSCGREETAQQKQKIQETPEALNDDKSVLKSYNRSDLIESLYAELVTKSPVLKKFEDDMEKLNSNSDELIQRYDAYNQKSKSYYQSADMKITRVKDSVLKKKIQLIIKSSKAQYTTKTGELNSLISQISKNKITIQDHFSILKIMLTLPLIEQYQQDNSLKTKQFKVLIKQQEKLIVRLDSLASYSGK